MIVLLLRVVLGLLTVCFRVYSGLFMVDLGFVSGLIIWVYSGSGYFGVL